MNGTQHEIRLEKSQWFIDWTGQMGFGVPAIDAADRRLFALVNALNQATLDGSPAKTVQTALEKILRLASLHFHREENFFAQVGYPLLKGHAALHRQMRAELEHVKDELSRVESRKIWMEYGLLVKQLFVEHTLRETAIYRTLPQAKSFH